MLGFRLEIRDGPFKDLQKKATARLEKKIETAGKIAGNAAVKYLREKTPKGKFSTSHLRDAYRVRTNKKTKTTSVFITSRKHQKKFDILDKGRGAVYPRSAKKLFIPRSRRGHKAIRSGTFPKKMFHGWRYDYVLAKRVSSVKALNLKSQANRLAKLRFTERLNKIKII